jgi:Rrf2 family protein
MNVSNKAKYGLRIMMYIATSGEATTTVQKIFSIEDVSKRYLEQIFSDLKKFGLVKSIKGKHGGYYIAKDLEAINVYDIIEALEGKVELGSLPTPGQKEIEAVFGEHLWTPLQESTEKLLKGVTLEQLVNSFNATQSNMYFI